MADLRAFVFLTLALIPVSLAKEPTLRIRPDKIQKAVGMGVYVSCEAEVDDPGLVTEMSWTAPDGEKVSAGDSAVFTSEDGSMGSLDLIITNLREQDVGTYTCSATYAGNQMLTAEVAVDSFMEIDFGDTPLHQTPFINDEAKIKCTPKAKPAPHVDWLKDNVPLRNDENHIIQQDGIWIKRVTEADEGVYRCRARVTELGSIKHVEIQVEVYIPPTIDQPPQDVKGVEEESATFECRASGKPAPSYSWVDKDNQPLKNTEGYFVDSETGTLTIHSLRPEHSGDYRCTASNDAGDDYKIANLQVLTKPKVEQYLNITTSVNSQAEMRCVATGSPPPQIVFKKESETDSYVAGVNHDDRIVVEQITDEEGREVGILKILSVARSDDGLYTCTAQSDGGVTQVWGHITVEFEPTFEEQGTTTEWSWEKAAVNLTCLATSIPNATIQWYLRNEEIEVNDVNLNVLSLGPVGVLRVKPVSSSYFGIYTCQATNVHGQAQLDIELKEAHAPGPIANAKVEKKTATTITWSLMDPMDDGGLPIQGYIVEYRTNEESWENAVRNTWTKGTSNTVDNLIPQKTYVFRFAAYSKAGNGQWGGEKSEEMPRHAQPEEPLIFGSGDSVVEHPYSDRYNLQWQVPLDNGKKIDFFQIMYYQVQDESGKWELVGEKSTKQVDYPGPSTFTIEDLHSNSHYKIELRAHNEIGFSTPAEMIIKTANASEMPASTQESGLGIGAIIAIIVIVILIAVVVVDVTCFFTKNAGLTATIAKKRGAKDKDKEAMLEDGKNAGHDPHRNRTRFSPSEPLLDKTTRPISRNHSQDNTPVENPWNSALQTFTPAHSTSSEMLLENIPKTGVVKSSEPVIVKVIKKNKEQNGWPDGTARLADYPASDMRVPMKSSRSTPLLDQSYSEDSIYAMPLRDPVHPSQYIPARESPTASRKPPPLPRRNPSTRLSHLSKSQEVLSDTLERRTERHVDQWRRKDYPFLHQTPVVQPITISVEDVTYNRSRIPLLSSRENLTGATSPNHISRSREVLNQSPRNPQYMQNRKEAEDSRIRSRSIEALDRITPVPNHMSRSREGLDQAARGPYHMSRSRESLDQAVREPHYMSKSRESLDQATREPYHMSRSREALNEGLGIQSVMSNRELPSGDSRVLLLRELGPRRGNHLNAPPKPPSLSSNSTLYQPLNAAQNRVPTRTAFRIAPYDDPGGTGPTGGHLSSPGLPQVGERAGLFPSRNTQPTERDSGRLNARSPINPPPTRFAPRMSRPNIAPPPTPLAHPSHTSPFAIPPPPPLQDGKGKQPMKTVTKVYFKEPQQQQQQQQPSHSLSMDNLDDLLDSRQPPRQVSTNSPAQITSAKSLGSLLDDSSSSMRSYGQPTLL